MCMNTEPHRVITGGGIHREHEVASQGLILARITLFTWMYQR